MSRQPAGDIEASKAFGALVKSGTKTVAAPKKGKASVKKTSTNKPGKEKVEKSEKKTKAKSEPVSKAPAAKKGVNTKKLESAIKGTPRSAKTVQTALKGGHITPKEAGQLNPLGGLRPAAKDVQSAYRENKISWDEAKNRSPKISLKR